MKYLFTSLLFLSYQNNTPNSFKIKVAPEFKTYWFAGKAEVTSYQLTKFRYGTLRQGKAVSIFVTEDFLKKEQVKTDKKSEQSTLVLKHNLLKHFVTGIYPYFIMNSTFTPLQSAIPLKATLSIQEWCGHSYTQLNRKKNFQITSHSYFEGKSHTEITLTPTYTEDGIWNLIRLSPSALPSKKFKIIPSIESSQLLNTKIQHYNAKGKILKKTDSTSLYTINIPNLKRKFSIEFYTNPPHQIIAWEKMETHNNTETLFEKATKLKTLHIPYWNLNDIENKIYRDSLKLNPSF